MEFCYIFFVIAVYVKCMLVSDVNGHARLLDPPQRSSLWRLGYKVPVNFNDNEVFCGGFRNLIDHGGKCGVCGDPFQGPRDHEAGGKYGSGIIVRHFSAKAKYITARVEVTAHHKGFFEFRICPHNDVSSPVTQECLDKYTLSIAEGREQGNPYKYFPPQGRFFDLHVEIPKGMICNQCVLQWAYKAGNSWGKSTSGRSCIGCGHQELFVNCADISIGTNVIKYDSDESSEESNESLEGEDKMLSGSEKFIWNLHNNVHKTKKNGLKHQEISAVNSSMSTTQRTQTQNTSSNCNRCYALPTWRHYPEMHDWCDRNCRAGNCPSCRCYCGCPDAPFHNPCSGKDLYENNALMDDWCWRECCETDCPRDKCACSSTMNKTGLLGSPLRHGPIKHTHTQDGAKEIDHNSPQAVHNGHMDIHEIVSVLKGRNNAHDKSNSLDSLSLPSADLVKDMKFLDYLRKSMESWLKTDAK